MATDLLDPPVETNETHDENAILRKATSADLTFAEGEEQTLVARISTQSIDRGGDVIVAKGVDIRNFTKNPVVLDIHNSGSGLCATGSGGVVPIIAKALWVKQDSNGLLAKMKFAPTDLGQQWWALYEGGFASAFSVGLLVEDMGEPTKEEIKANPEWKDAGRIVRKSELVEFSAVPIPANPEALVEAISKGTINISDSLQKAFGVKPSVVPDSLLITNAGTDTDVIKWSNTSGTATNDLLNTDDALADAIQTKVCSAIKAQVDEEKNKIWDAIKGLQDRNGVLEARNEEVESIVRGLQKELQDQKDEERKRLQAERDQKAADQLVSLIQKKTSEQVSAALGQVTRT